MLFLILSIIIIARLILKNNYKFFCLFFELFVLAVGYLVCLRSPFITLEKLITLNILVLLFLNSLIRYFNLTLNLKGSIPSDAIKLMVIVTIVTLVPLHESNFKPLALISFYCIINILIDTWSGMELSFSMKFLNYSRLFEFLLGVYTKLYKNTILYSLITLYKVFTVLLGYYLLYTLLKDCIVDVMFNKMLIAYLVFMLPFQIVYKVVAYLYVQKNEKNTLILDRIFLQASILQGVDYVFLTILFNGLMHNYSYFPYKEPEFVLNKEEIAKFGGYYVHQLYDFLNLWDSHRNEWEKAYTDKRIPFKLYSEKIKTLLWGKFCAEQLIIKKNTLMQHLLREFVMLVRIITKFLNNTK